MSSALRASRGAAPVTLSIRSTSVPVETPAARRVAAARAAVGHERVIQLPNPIMAAEDFSYVLNEVPGAMMFLGGTPPERDPRTAPANHSNLVTFDEDAMTTGVEIYAQMALRHLGVTD